MRKNAQCGLTGGVPDFREQSARARARAMTMTRLEFASGTVRARTRTRGNPQIIVFPRKSLSCSHGVRMEFKSKKTRRAFLSLSL